MKLAFLCSALLGIISLNPSGAQAANFNYHGFLSDSGKPAEGSYDVRLSLYTDAAAGKAIGAPITLNKLSVHDGHFSTIFDFGVKPEVLQAAYLVEQIRNSTGRNDFTKANSDATLPLSLYMGSYLQFDGDRVLTDGNATVFNIKHCNFYNGYGNCIQETCRADGVSNCQFFAEACLLDGGTYSGSAEGGQCDR